MPMRWKRTASEVWELADHLVVVAPTAAALARHRLATVLGDGVVCEAIVVDLAALLRAANLSAALRGEPHSLSGRQW